MTLQVRNDGSCAPRRVIIEEGKVSKNLLIDKAHE